MMAGPPTANQSLRDPEETTIRSQVQKLKHDRIVAQATRMFYADCYQGTTLDDIAKALGFTKPFIYSHFRSKVELLAFICRQGTEACLSIAQQALKQDGSATERMDWLIREFTNAVIAHEPNIAIYFREVKHLDPETVRHIQAMQKRFDQNLARLLESGIASGEFEVPDVRATTLAIGGLISWIYTWHRPGSRYPEEELSKTMANLVLRMVEKRVPVKPRLSRS
jgi:AcrR family transcriptional regulator